MTLDHLDHEADPVLFPTKQVDLSFANGVPFELSLAEIYGILPHRGDKLLLDSVVGSSDGVVGYLTVRNDHCEGHVIGNEPIFRGVDVLEMAAQLLGMYTFIVFPDLRGKMCILKSGCLESAPFSATIGDKISIVLDRDSVKKHTVRDTEIISVESLYARRSDQRVVGRVSVVLSVWDATLAQSKD